MTKPENCHAWNGHISQVDSLETPIPKILTNFEWKRAVLCILKWKFVHFRHFCWNQVLNFSLIIKGLTIERSITQDCRVISPLFKGNSWSDVTQKRTCWESEGPSNYWVVSDHTSDKSLIIWLDNLIIDPNCCFIFTLHLHFIHSKRQRSLLNPVQNADADNGNGCGTHLLTLTLMLTLTPGNDCEKYHQSALYPWKNAKNAKK